MRYIQWKTLQPLKGRKSCHCDKGNKPRGDLAKRNHLDRETKIPYDLIYTWDLKKKARLTEAENSLVTRGWELRQEEKMEDVGQRVQTFSYKMNKFWRRRYSMDPVMVHFIRHLD